MKLKPLYDRVVIQEITKEGVTPSGLFIPESAMPEVLEGEIVAVGPETKWAQVGQRALFHTMVGREVVLADVAYRVIREGEIVSILVSE